MRIMRSRAKSAADSAVAGSPASSHARADARITMSAETSHLDFRTTLPAALGRPLK